MTRIPYDQAAKGVISGAFEGAGRGRVNVQYEVASEPQWIDAWIETDPSGWQVVQDMFMNETARELAHVVLPAACAYEKEGTFMNAERRVQRVRKVIEPPGEARTDWEPLCDLARAMGRGQGFSFRSAEAIWEEIRRVWRAGRGITYARLDGAGIQWPCPSEDHPGTTLLHTESFGKSLRATLRLVDYTPTSERTSADYPFILNTGRSLYQFNAGTMTMRTLNRVLRPNHRLDISPADAARLGFQEGECVRVRSRHGSAVLPIHVTEEVASSELFATFNDPSTCLNAVTGNVRDEHTDTPEYKVTAVRVEKA